MSSIERRSNPEPWWRSLDELTDTPRFRAFLEAEFPAEVDPSGISRRRWLQLMGSSLALAGVAGCRWEKQEIRPFAERPEGRTPGKSQRFATAMPLGDSATGLIVTAVDGRPIKVEGNPLHPQSLGATDVLSQAAILDLYDPDRSRTIVQVTDQGETEHTWDEFTAVCWSHFGKLRASGGAGLCVLAEAGSSPTVDALQSDLLRTFPKAQWFEYEPISDDNHRAGATVAFGRPVRTHFRFDRARVILCLDSDLLGSHPMSVRYAHDFADRREAVPERMNRLYAAESRFSLTGAAADHRLPLPSRQIPGLIQLLEREVARGVGSQHTAASSAGGQSQRMAPFVRAVTKDLIENAGHSIVSVGPGQAPAVHAAVHCINELLGNTGVTVDYIQLPHPDRPSHGEALSTLVDEIRAGNVSTLLVLGGNPVYNAPVDLAFAEALEKVQTTIHLSLYRNETSRRCTWHIPRAHFLESWGDVRSYEGTYSVRQPLIAPLFGGRSSIEVLASIVHAAAEDADGPVSKPEELVRRTFEKIAGQEKAQWGQTLRDGLLAGSEWPKESLATSGSPEIPADLTKDVTHKIRMIEAARQSGAILTVGLVRRFYAASRFVKQLLDEGWLGQIRSFDVREGAIYSWPVASDFFFRQEAAGGGVLVDTGAYTLDMLLWWLGDYEGVEYYDDAMGGVEANCELHLTLKNGVKGIVELSRTRALRNTCLIKGQCGILEIGVGFNPTVCLELCDRSARLEGRVLAQRFPQEGFLDVMRQQLEDFARAVCGESQPFVPGEEGRRSIALFEACYKARQPLELPWLRPESLVNQARCT